MSPGLPEKTRRILGASWLAAAALTLGQAVLVTRGYAGLTESLSGSHLILWARIAAWNVTAATLLGGAWGALAFILPVRQAWRFLLASLPLSGLAGWFVAGALTGHIYPAGIALASAHREARLLALLSVAGILALGLLVLALSRYCPELPARVAFAGLALGGVIVAFARVPIPAAEPHPVPLMSRGVLESDPVVIVSIDTLRADHMSLYGYPRTTTPVIDEWAQAATVYERASTVKGYTGPALASLMTGMSPQSHGARRHPQPLSPAIDVLAEIYREAGFETAAFVTNPAITDLQFRRDQGFDLWSTFAQQAAIAPHILAQVEGWIDDAEGPFFLWVHLNDPHTPYLPPPPHDGAFVGDPHYRAAPDVAIRPVAAGRVGSGEYNLTTTFGEAWDQQGFAETDLESGAFVVSQYDGEIAYTDQHLGSFLQRLRESVPRALVVLTSDHGESLVEHGDLFVHGTNPFEPSINIPLVFSHPELRAGRSERLTGLIDVLPTLVDLYGLPLPAGIDGISLAPELLGRGADVTDRSVLVEARNTGSYPVLALRSDRHKVVLSPRRWTAPLDLLLARQLGSERLSPLLLRSYRIEVYDLDEDPGEISPVAGNAAASTLTSTVWKMLQRQHLTRQLYDSGESVDELDAETLRELRALGYIQ